MRGKVYREKGCKVKAYLAGLDILFVSDAIEAS